MYQFDVEMPEKRPRSGVSVAVKALVAFLFPMFVCGGIVAGYYFYDTVRQYVMRLNLPELQIAGITAPSVSSQPGTTPQSKAAALPTLRAPNVAAGERINVLFMGIDRRPTETCPCRSDTMIVATFDPRTKTGGMLSIPRDLYIELPSPVNREDRINTALFYGDAVRYPGGGPAFAKKTVEYQLGIPIHYYVLVDFQGFRRLVDALGGIDVDVPVAIHDTEYPTENYGIKTIDIPAGRVHMNGEVALQYARSRHTTNDFDRSRRQMQIILALRDRALKLDVLPKLPTLINQLHDAVESDLQPEQVIALAPQAMGVKASDIKVRAIDQSMTVEIITNTGADVLWPERAKIGVLVRELFPELMAIQR